LQLASVRSESIGAAYGPVLGANGPKWYIMIQYIAISLYVGKFDSFWGCKRGVKRALLLNSYNTAVYKTRTASCLAQRLLLYG